MPTINSATQLDERYSPKIIEVLRSETFLIPGVTYNADYDGDATNAASVIFHKPTRGTVSAGAIGGDYSHVEYADSAVQCNICNAFRKSTKLRNIAADSVSFDAGSVYIAQTTEDVREGRDRGAIAAIVNGGTASAVTTALTSATVKGAILDLITAAKKKGAKPSVIVVSPTVSNLLAQSQLTSGGVFTPETNEKLIQGGSLGRLFGCSFLENKELSDSTNTAVALNTAVGSAVSGGVDISTVDFLVYDRRFFAMVNHLTDGRIVPSQDFAGSYCNVEDNCGFKVLDADGVFYYKHA